MATEYGGFSDWMRAQLLGIILCPHCGHRRFTLRQMSEFTDIPIGTLHRFLKGGGLRVSTTDRLVAFLRVNDIEWPGQP